MFRTISLLTLTALVVMCAPVIATTTTEENVTCANCGEVSIQSYMMSSSSSGYYDLDLRPPPVRRYSLWLWVQRCPHCGYCSGDISQDLFEDYSIIESEEYGEQLEEDKLPDLANSFLCMAMIEEDNGLYADAFWSTLYAAWVCDDEENYDWAMELRFWAVFLADMAADDDQSLTDDPALDYAVLTDVLRRAGKFDAAQEVAEEGLEDPFLSDEMIRAMLEFQLILISEEDWDAHNMGEIPDIEKLMMDAEE